VAAEITSVGKVIYETGWDANKPIEKPRKLQPCNGIGCGSTVRMINFMAAAKWRTK